MNKDCKTAFVRQMKILPSVIPDALGKFPETYQWYDAIAHGFIVVGGVDNQVIRNISPEDFYIINELYGVNPNQMNATFYADIQKVKSTPILDRIYEQIRNYASTYGAKLFGDKPRTTLPIDQWFNTPEFNSYGSGMEVTVIKLVGRRDAEIMLGEFAKNLRGLNPVLKKDMEALLPYLNVRPDDLKSFELMVMYCRHEHCVPGNIINKLRLAVYIATGSPVLINSAREAKKIKMGLPYISPEDETTIVLMFSSKHLSQVFFRYKKIILAFKTIPALRHVINRARRMADRNYERTPDSALIYFSKNVNEVNLKAITETLDHASTFDLIKLLNFSTATLFSEDVHGELTPKAYQIRNGQVYIKKDGLHKLSIPYQSKLFEVLFDIHQRIRVAFEKYRGVTFIVPKGLEYTLPTSSKQMVGPFPYGTILNTPEGAFTLGIHWFNGPNDEMTDLDFHLVSEGHHYGWNSFYGSHENADPNTEIYFSGDMTNAPRPDGAAEAFYFNPQAHEKVFTAMVNKYSGPRRVDFQLFISSDPTTMKSRGYFMDPNHLLTIPIPLTISDENKDTMMLGVLKGTKFYFYGHAVGGGRVPSEYAKYLGDAIVQKLANMYTLEKLCAHIGAEIATPEEWTKMDHSKPHIDLQPQNITSATFIDLVSGTLEPEVEEEEEE